MKLFKDMSSNIRMLYLFYLAIAINYCESIVVRNGAYENIVVEIKDVPASVECSQFLWSLEVRYFVLIFKYFGFKLFQSLRDHKIFHVIIK